MIMAAGGKKGGGARAVMGVMAAAMVSALCFMTCGDNLIIVGIDPTTIINKVTYNANGGSNAPAAQTKRYNIALTLSSNLPVRTGYTFTGWNTKQDGSGTSYKAGTRYTANAALTLYAQWSAKTYEVTFNSQGGSKVSPQTVRYGERADEPNAPTLTDKAFAGWYKEAGLTTEWDFSKDEVTDDITLYAKWAVNVYTVTFDANGGSSPPAPITGASVTLPSMTRNGFTFGGWNTNSSGTGTNYAAGSSYTPTGNVTLYAKWNTIRVTDIRFDGNKTVLTLSVGGTERLTVIVTPTNATNQNVNWSSSNPNVAAVVNGLVTGKKPGNTTITVTTVDGGKTVTCEVTVTSFGITLDKTGTQTFPTVTIPYTAPTPLNVTVRNTGNQPTGALDIALSGTNAASFTLSTASIASIAVGGTGAFTVAPKTGLAANTYTATVTVTGGNGITAAFNVSFTVNADPVITLKYEVINENSPNDDTYRVVGVAPGATGSVINVPREHSCDGSVCGVSHSLANVTEIGDNNDSPFDAIKNNITSVTIGPEVVYINSFAFKDCENITSLSFGSNSNVEQIRDGAFRECWKIANITIPNSVNRIGGGAFSVTAYHYFAPGTHGIDLGTSVTDIDGTAFQNRRGIRDIIIPASVTSIGEKAFDYCADLTRVEFKGGDVTFSGNETFPQGSTGAGGPILQTKYGWDANNPNDPFTAQPGTYTRTANSDNWAKLP